MKKSEKMQGAQQEHVVKGYLQIHQPDITVIHAPTSCEGCGCKLDQVEGSCVEKRQVFEIPHPKIKVTEYRLEKKICPYCGEHNKEGYLNCYIKIKLSIQCPVT